MDIYGLGERYREFIVNRYDLLYTSVLDAINDEKIDNIDILRHNLRGILNKTSEDYSIDNIFDD